MSPNPRKSFVVGQICACIFVAAGVWLSSGTMAPYASTLEHPLILKPCSYLLNTDNPHFEATFLMLDGAPKEKWAFSVVLRRTLFPLLAYPAMKIFGFLVGGVLTSLILQVAAFAAFVIYVRRRIGDAAAWTAMLLLATYPGIYYWAGLPYSYAAIVPATLGATIAARELESTASAACVALLSLLLGVLFLAYDLMPFFAPAAVLILLGRRKFAWAAIAVPLMLLPSFINKQLLIHLAGMDFANENSRFYNVILDAYFHPPALSAWAGHVSGTPWTLVKSFFYSNFVFLPALFLIVAGVNAATRRVAMGPAVRWVLLTGLGLFLFINLAPPFRGWQFRGDGMSRLYQPIFAAMILFIAEFVQHAGEVRKCLAGVVAATVVINASIVLGPAMRNPLAGWTYLRFYAHAASPQLNKNLELFGRRPLGFCDPSIAIDNPPPKHKGPKAATKPAKVRHHKVKPPKKHLKKKHHPAATDLAGDPSARAVVAAPCRDG